MEIKNLMKTESNVPLQDVNRMIYKKAELGTWWTNKEKRKDTQDPDQRILIKGKNCAFHLVQVYNKPKVRDLSIIQFRGHLGKVFGRNENIYVVNVKPGKIAGGHFHKKIMESFFVLKGKAEVTLIDTTTREQEIISLGSKIVYEQDGKKYKMGIFFNPGVAHLVTNVGKEKLILLVINNGEHTSEDVYYHPKN